MSNPERRAKNLLEEWLSSLKHLNTKFPATQEFLTLEGVKHVEDLNPEQLKGLEKHLIKVRNLLMN